MQAQLESDRVLWFSARTTASRSPFSEDASLKDAWQKLQRATELLEAERANFCDEKLAFAEHEAEMKRREEKIKETATKNEALNNLQPALPPSQATPNVSMGAATISAVKTLSRSPFEMAKSVFSGKKTGE